jgi:hypothetical protein
MTLLGDLIAKHPKRRPRKLVAALLTAQAKRLARERARKAKIDRERQRNAQRFSNW